jgi:sugar lactone lactonase YvrE
MPVPRPTSVAFGGKDLATLFITSARTRLPASTLSEAPLSGGIFACLPGERGLPTTDFAG